MSNNSGFNKIVGLRIVSFTKILSWLVIVVYALQWAYSIISTFSMMSTYQPRNPNLPDWFNADVIWNILSLMEQPLRGLVYFAVLQGVAQVLLLFMDLEFYARKSGN